MFKQMFEILTYFKISFPVKVVTVNCARIIYGNQVATNGAVHVIDRVIRPVSGTIKDILEENENLSSFAVCKNYFF